MTSAIGNPEPAQTWCGAGRQSAMTLVASELLPVLLVLYPALLLLDDVEPGFVRSVLNPHGFLLAVLVAAMVAAPAAPSPAWSPRALRWWMVAAVLALGLWMFWKLGGGTLGVVAALLTVVALIAGTRALSGIDTARAP